MWLLSTCLLISALAGKPQNAAAYDPVRQAYEAGERALQKGDLPAAEREFLEVLHLVPEDLGARINLGVVFMRKHDWNRALHYLQEAEARAPDISGIRLNIGLAEYRKGDYSSAIPAFESVLRDDPASAQARRLLGLSYLFEERYSEASATLEPLWPTANSDLSYLYSLAVAAGNAKQRELEDRSLARLMQVGNDSPLLHLLHGKAYLAHEDFGRALDELRVAAQADPKLPLLHYNLGVVYRREGQLDQARQEFMSDIAAEPEVAFSYDQLGVISYTLQQNRRAETYFRDALQRNPRLGTSWFGLAKVYKQEKRYSEALKAIEQAGAIDPKSASAHYLRAQILTELQRRDEAETEMATVRRLKRESLDKLEQEVNGPSYHDPGIVRQTSD